MRRLGFLLIGMLLFGVALPLQGYAQRRTQPARAASTALRDHTNIPLGASTGARINAPSQPDGPFKTAQAGAPVPAYLAETWRTGAWGYGIGASGMIPQDLDNNGSLELILASGWGNGKNYFWFVVSYLPAEERYEQIWMSRMYKNETFINRIVTADVNQDGRLEIYVALRNGQLEIYDGPTRKLIRTISTGLDWLSDVLLADPDGDGIQELLVSSPSGTRAYAASDYAPTWQITQGGYDLKVANVDADAALEIVVNGHVLDGATRAVEWTYDFGWHLNVADVNNDGKAEIMATPGMYKIYGFDAELKSRVWEITTITGVDALHAGDIDADGDQEIVYGDGAGGSIHVLDGTSRLPEWKISNPDSGITRIAFADVDGDGATELLWGGGTVSSGPDNLYIADIATRAVEWKSPDLGQPLSSLGVGDVDGDGRQEIVMVSHGSTSPNGYGLILIYDAETHALEWQSGVVGSVLTRIHSLRLGDVNGDDRQDILVATEESYEGVIEAYDGLTHERMWQSAKIWGTNFNSLTIADVDADGNVEVVGGQDVDHNGWTGSRIVVLDGATGSEEWRTDELGRWNANKNIEVSDADRDGHPDILVSMAGVAYLYDGVTRQQTWQGGSNVSLFSSANVDGLPGPELLLGADEGVLTVLDGKTRQPQHTITIGDKPVTALRVGDMDRDGVAELFITSGSYLYVYDTANWTEIWQSDWLSDVVALKNHLAVKDINGDQIDEVVVGTNESIIEFQFNAPPYDLEVGSSQSTVQPGQTITYTAALTNLTDVSATLRLTDTLPLHTELVSGSLQVTGGTATAQAGMAKWLVTLPASGQATMTLALRVSPAAPAGAVLTSTFGSNNGRFSITRRQTLAVEVALKRLYLPATFAAAPARRPATR
jgi:uncharacterized repeat protein (TIGR01451 family)